MDSDGIYAQLRKEGLVALHIKINFCVIFSSVVYGASRMRMNIFSGAINESSSRVDWKLMFGCV
jgi:hypothetical protein